MKKINGKNLLLVLLIMIVLAPFPTVLAKYENPYDRWLFGKIKSARDYFKSEPSENKTQEPQTELTESERAEVLKEVREDMRKKDKYGLYCEEEFNAAIKAKEAAYLAAKEAKNMERADKDPNPKNIAEKAQIATKTCENLKNKAREIKNVIERFLGNTFDAKFKVAIDDLKKNPNSLELQLNMCDILMNYTDELYSSFTKVGQADLGALRDRVVQSFKTISELKAAEAQKYQNRANQTKGIWKSRYEQLGTACLNFSKAYELRAQSYQKIPMDEQTVEIQDSIEYLNNVKEVLASLEEFIKNVQADEETFKQLLDTQKSLVNLQKSILNFSEVVLDGAFNASGNLPNTPKE